MCVSPSLMIGELFLAVTASGTMLRWRELEEAGGEQGEGHPLVQGAPYC